jgi:hypothetical protein
MLENNNYYLTFKLNSNIKEDNSKLFYFLEKKKLSK